VKRDMDLARELLLQITARELESDAWGEKEIYHIKMLFDVGYIQGVTFFQPLKGDLIAKPTKAELTWAGHEFLETIRRKSVWEKIKKVLKDKGLDVTVETIKLVAPNVLAAILK
jgi:Hypothetical protein (DUF2513)